MHITFIQDFIDLIRGKKFRKSKKLQKLKEMFENNNISFPNDIKKKIILNIVGKNNTVVLPYENNINGNITINIYGNNNEVIIGDNFHLSRYGLLSITIGQNHPYFGEVKNSSFQIGKNTSVESLNYVTFNSNSFCNIEDDCMLSSGITIYNTDAHPIFKKGTNEIINKVKGITIGKHSWIGMNVTILKNSIIPSNSIVGCNAVCAMGGVEISHTVLLREIQRKLLKKMLIGIQMVQNMVILIMNRKVFICE